ncbi:nitroreductase [Candidatus Bathyarchaeota archaeon]|nr:nitroreductase [Candidatus Bathyarchaeota archaeon]NIR15383.1 nitroreductase [Desulfobacterales bacterium]NIU81850.1 nitroreductase [Candidatus Bathyarchaeota archaeon]NIV68321.1 nitroreductase [Candidatus Bathyarchaeota archaeon]NIW34857.1 nitroreductase [Candidatus Bathyarchaeota archaeon]
MDFYDVIQTRRSVRSYKDDSIPEEVLNRVLEAVRVAPSGSNRQPWKFILVKDDGLKEKMVSFCNNQRFIAEAPLVVVACGQRLPLNRGGYMGEMSVLLDVSIAFTHLILSARAEGLGTCWIGAFDNQELKKLLGVPEGYEVVAATPLGYPSEEVFTEPKGRKDLDEIVSVNRF